MPISEDAQRSDGVLSIDIGGTKMAAAVVDGSGQIQWTQRTATPADADAEELWSALRKVVESAPRELPVAACGVGCGGPMTADGEYVSPLNIPGWRRFPLRARLAQLAGLPTWVDNDAKALALGEGWVGAAAGYSDYLSMVVSTGVGAGIVLDGRLLDGNSGNAGHIGHVIVEPDGRLCRCGALGCLEAEASGTAIAAATGRPPSEAGAEAIERAGRLVGRAVASVANLLDLQLATVAGSVALGFGEPFFAAAQAELSARARLDFSAPCRIVPSPLGELGGLIGAAAVGRRGYLAAGERHG